MNTRVIEHAKKTMDESLQQMLSLITKRGLQSRIYYSLYKHRVSAMDELLKHLEYPGQIARTFRWIGAVSEAEILKALATMGINPQEQSGAPEVSVSVHFGRLPVSALTVRDYFAAKAMQGVFGQEGVSMKEVPNIAESAYLMADAMLEARK